MCLSFLACGIHLWVAIVAGRAALLALKYKISKEDSDLNDNPMNVQRGLRTEDFTRFLVLCEQLQLAGTITFFPAALILIFSMFNHIWFGISLYIVAAISIIFVFRAGFWKVSVLVSNANHAWRRLRDTLPGQGVK